MYYHPTYKSKFEVVNGEEIWRGKGQGRNKKDAEKAAAENALAKLAAEVY